MSAVRALLVLAIVAGATMMTASPCLACECTARSPEDIVGQADRAFVGRVVGQTPEARGTTQTFEVAVVYKGALGPTVDLWAEVGTTSLSSCAVLFPEHERVAVAMSVDAQGRWTTTSCSYLTEKELRKAAGPPHAPTKGMTSAPSASVGGPTATPIASAVPSAVPSLGVTGERRRRKTVPLWVIAVLGVAGAVSAIGASLLAGGRRGAAPRSFERATGSAPNEEPEQEPDAVEPPVSFGEAIGGPIDLGDWRRGPPGSFEGD